MSEMEHLFLEWKKLALEKSNHFIEDGVICEDSWKKSNKKILFVLKETNDYKESITELIKTAVTERPKSALWKRPTFHNIGRWAYGLLNLPNSFNKYDEAHKNRKNALLSCSFINIKKTSGKRTAKKKEIEENAEKYRDFLKNKLRYFNQILLYLGARLKS